MSELIPVPLVLKSESISSKKTMTGTPSSAFSLAALEHEADLPLGLADVLVQQLGTLDVQEVAADLVVARRLCDLLRERIGDGLGDQGLAAPGGP